MGIKNYLKRNLSKKFVLYVFIVFVMVFLWGPLILMSVFGFGKNAWATLPLKGWTLKWTKMALSDEKGAILLGPVSHSIFVSGTAAFVSTVLGVLASLGIVKSDWTFKEEFRLQTIIPMMIPGVVFGFVFLTVFRLLQFPLSLWSVILTHALYGIPFVVLVVTPRLYTFNWNLEQAAQDLGASKFTAFRTITLPILFPAFFAGYIFAFMRSWGDFIRAYFVIGTKDIFTTQLWSMLKFGITPEINAISFLILLVTAIFFALLWKFFPPVREALVE